jgi:hypothetical protein
VIQRNFGFFTLGVYFFFSSGRARRTGPDFSKSYFTNSISPGRQVLSNQGSVGL